MNRQLGKSSNDTKSPLLVSTTTSSKKKNWKPSENYSKFRSHIVLKCFELACMGGPHILWLVDGQGRAITKSNKGSDERLADSVLTSISRVVIDNVVTWESLHYSARWFYLKVVTAQVT